MRTFSLDNSSVSGGEINLRQEVINIIYGLGSQPPRGTWTIYRKANTAVRSTYWNDERAEAIGGPPWEYDDYMIRARHSASSTGGQDQEVRDIMALIDTPIHIFYMDYRIRPKKEDHILQITNCTGIDPPSIFTVIGKYDILLVQTPRDQSGRIEYYKCFAKKVLSRGDRTLENIDIKETITWTQVPQ